MWLGGWRLLVSGARASPQMGRDFPGARSALRIGRVRESGDFRTQQLEQGNPPRKIPFMYGKGVPMGPQGGMFWSCSVWDLVFFQPPFSAPFPSFQSLNLHLSSDFGVKLNRRKHVHDLPPTWPTTTNRSQPADGTRGPMWVVRTPSIRLAFLWLGFAMTKSREAGMEIARKMWEARGSGVGSSSRVVPRAEDVRTRMFWLAGAGGNEKVGEKWPRKKLGSFVVILWHLISTLCLLSWGYLQ